MDTKLLEVIRKHAPLSVILLLPLFAHCDGNKNPQEIIGKILILPPVDQCIIVDQDKKFHSYSQRAKVIVYYNNLGCSSCKLKELYIWKELISKINNSQNNDSLNVDILFIFKPPERSPDFSRNLKVYHLPTPLIIDCSGYFEINNNISDNALFNTYLVNQKGEVMLIGTPIYNPKLWQSYKEKIFTINQIKT